MYCVIQEVELKKQNKNGYAKKLESEPMTFTIMGETKTKYYYSYSSESFERPVKKAYRISVHDSYRQSGKIKKHQYCIGTVNYYDFATDFFTLYDYDSRITTAANAMKKAPDELYKLIENKLKPIQEKIVKEFQNTEEYKTHAEHERITTAYAANGIKFKEKYNCDRYDEIYDVFGNVMNPSLLEQVKRDNRARKEYEEKSRNYQRSYYENNYGNYNNSSSSSYGILNHGNYTEDEKAALKQFYKTLSKKYHPDANPDIDTSKQMQLLNQLKQDWGI